jgi:hypothetical protein
VCWKPSKPYLNRTPSRGCPNYLSSRPARMRAIQRRCVSGDRSERNEMRRILLMRPARPRAENCLILSRSISRRTAAVAGARRARVLLMDNARPRANASSWRTPERIAASESEMVVVLFPAMRCSMRARSLSNAEKGEAKPADFASQLGKHRASNYPHSRSAGKDPLFLEACLFSLAGRSNDRFATCETTRARRPIPTIQAREAR